MYQYLFYDCHMFIFLQQCEIHQRQFQIPLFFSILFSTPLNKVDLILATQSKLLFESNYLKSITEGLSFQIHLCQTQVKFEHSLPILPLIENTRGVNVPWSN